MSIQAPTTTPRPGAAKRESLREKAARCLQAEEMAFFATVFSDIDLCVTPGGKYRVGRAGCTCKGSRNGERNCYHVEGYRIVHRLPSVEQEQADRIATAAAVRAATPCLLPPARDIEADRAFVAANRERDFS